RATSCGTRSRPRSSAGPRPRRYLTTRQMIELAGTAAQAPAGGAAPARVAPCAAAAGSSAAQRSAPEEELGIDLVIGAEEQVDLVGQQLMVLEHRVAVDDLERRVAGLADPLAVAPERRELEVVPALLPLAHDRALAAQLEIDLGELEAVGGLDHRFQ